MPHIPPQKLLDGRAAYACVDDVAITILAVPEWSDADVIRFLEETARLTGGVSAKASLHHIRGASFNANQRRLAHQWLQDRGMESSARNAVISDSALTRGALTAFAWLTQMSAKAFSPDEVNKACIWLTQGLVATPAEVEASFARCGRLFDQRLCG